MRPTGPLRDLRARTASRWLPRLLGPVVLAVILARLDVADVAAALESVWALPIAGACLAVLPTFPLRSWRWRILLEAGGTRLGGIEALNAYAFSIVVGAATPGRIGELIKVGFLRAKGVPTSEAVLSVALDRLFDIAFLVVVGMGAVTSLFRGSAAIVVATLVGAAALGTVGLWYLFGARGRRGVGRMLSPRLSGTWVRRITELFESAVSQTRAMPASALAAAGALTALTWITTYLAVFLCAIGLGLDVSFLDICGVTAVSSLVTFLPISILGLGTRDASLIALLAPHGVPATGAVALSALYLGITLWVVLVCSYSLLTPAARTWKRR